MRALLLFLFIGFVTIVKSQDPILAQFQFQKLELNPAYGGHSGNGILLLNFASRTSFYPVRGPFTYATTAVDFSPCTQSNLRILGLLGIGALVNRETQGDGYYSKTRVGLNLAYAVAISKNSSLAVGLRPGFIQQSINWDEFTFSDQLDPLNGISRPSFNHGAAIDLSTTHNMDLGIKFNFYKKDKPKVMIGLSGFNLTQPKIGIFSQFTLKRRYSLHSTTIWEGENLRYIHKTNFRLDVQGDNRFIGLNKEFILDKKLGFIGGFSIPFSSQISNDVNMSLISLASYYQFNPSLLMYISYENNVSGRLINGKTSSFEIGFIIRTARSTCEKISLKNAFDFNSNQKITTPLGCPKMKYNGKIESF